MFQRKKMFYCFFCYCVKYNHLNSTNEAYLQVAHESFGQWVRTPYFYRQKFVHTSPYTGQRQLLFEAMTVSHMFFFIILAFSASLFYDNACVSFFLFHCAWLVCSLRTKRKEKKWTREINETKYFEKKTTEVNSRQSSFACKEEKLKCTTEFIEWGTG